MFTQSMKGVYIMAYIGSEIVQSRIWIDPNEKPIPILNYKLTYPITVFDAVRKDMYDEDSQTLTQALENIYTELRGKQDLIPAMDPSNIVTYGGIAGVVGSIEITTHIPYEAGEQSDFKIPTEKAVGQLLRDYGVIPSEGYTVDLFNFYVTDGPDGELVIEYSGDETFYPILEVDAEGNLILESNDTPFDIALTQFFFSINGDDLIVTAEDSSPSVFTVLWNRIVGRPEIYDSLGKDEHGVISQAGITAAFDEINTKIENIWDDMESSPLAIRLREHINDTDNPHNITPSAIGAISKAEFGNHLLDTTNPHAVTKAQVGLGNVDNTSDADKPISRSTQAAIDQLNELIGNITGIIGDIKYVVNIDYTQSNGRLDIRYNDGSVVGVTIITDGLIDEIIPDPDSHALIIQELNGSQKSINLEDLITAYIGHEGTNIDIEVVDNVINANIVSKSITAAQIADGSLINSLFANRTIAGDKIQDLTITTRNLANGTVTADKIASGTITAGQISTHSITGRNLFTTSTANSVLAVKTSSGDAEWSKVTGQMISSETITSDNIATGTITSDKIKDRAIITSKIESEAITNAKLAPASITSDKIVQGTITGIEFANDLVIPGTPTLASNPRIEANGREIITAQWVKYLIEHFNINLADRSVLGRHLFSSPVKNRVLAVLETDGDPVYTQINSDMLGANSVVTETLADGSVSTIKIQDNAITGDKIAINSITSQKIGESEVKSVNIFPSDEADMVLGVDTNAGHPLYTKITKGMLGDNIITASKIADHSVSADKIIPPEYDHVVLSYVDENYSPTWSKITSDLIENRAIIADKLFTSPESNMILAVTEGGTSPVWTKITDAMIDSITFDSDSILPGAITHEKLAADSVDETNIIDDSVSTAKIQDEAVTAEKLFKPESASRVLGISKDEDKVDWITIETEMLQDHIITPNKMWLSPDDHMILGTINSNDNPDYLKLNEDFFEDHAFSSRKLAENLTLYGTPTLHEHPVDTSNDHSIADTAWVNAAIEAAIEHSGGGSADWHDIPDGALQLSKLEASEEKNKVVAVVEDGGLPVYTQVTEGMIDNGAITTNKIDRNIELLGAPKLEIRPPETAADENGNGDLIPDVQWVRNEITEQVVDAFEHYVPPQDRFSRILSPISNERIIELIEGATDADRRPDVRDEFNNVVERLDADQFVEAYDQGQRITESSSEFYIRDREYEPIAISRIEQIIRGSVTPKEIDEYQFAEVIPGPGPAVLGPKTVVTEFLDDRAVTGDKLFTTPHENSVLAVTWPNEDPVWTKITHPMLGTGVVAIENMMATTLRDKVLGLDDNGVPAWINISGATLSPGSVTEDKLADGAVTANKIADFSIGPNKFKEEPIFSTEHLFDNAVTTRKIADKAITAAKIANGGIGSANIANKAITSGKLEDAIVLPKNATIKSSDLERKSLRNVTVSADLPTGCASGEIWLQYAT